MAAKIARIKKQVRNRKARQTHKALGYVMMLAVALVFLLLIDAIPYGKAPANFPSLPPHQFFGSVSCSAPAKIVPQNLQIRAVTTHTTTTTNYTINSTTPIIDAAYGYKPNLFFAEGIINGNNITLYVGNENVFSTSFSSSSITEKNLVLSSNCVDENRCGNSVCEASESCSSCVVDCGTCDDDNDDGGDSNIVNETISYTVQTGASMNDASTGLVTSVSNLVGHSISEQQIANFIDQSSQISPYIDVTGNLYTNGSVAILTVRIENSIQNQLSSFIVYEKIPKSFSQNSSKLVTISTGSSYNILKSDPEYVFLYKTLDAGQIITIQHKLVGNASASVLASLSIELYSESINTVQCTESTTRCSGLNVESCENGVWINSELCDERCAEVSGAQCVGRFADICTESEMRCSGNDVQKCESDSWITQETCEKGCLNNTCTIPQKQDYMIIIASLLAVCFIVIGFVAYRLLNKESDIDRILHRVGSKNDE